MVKTVVGVTRVLASFPASPGAKPWRLLPRFVRGFFSPHIHREKMRRRLTECEMRAHCAAIPLFDMQQSFALCEAVDRAQHQRMLDVEQPRKGAAVAGNIGVGGDKKSGLERGQTRISLLQLPDRRKEVVRIGCGGAHAARLRNVTMIDLEVGVSLSSPALASGTSTFSSG